MGRKIKWIKKPVTCQVHADLYESIERERQRFRSRGYNISFVESSKLFMEKRNGKTKKR